MTREEVIASLTAEEVVLAAHRLGLHDDHMLHIECTPCLIQAIAAHVADLEQQFGHVLSDREQFLAWLRVEVIGRKHYLMLHAAGHENYIYWQAVQRKLDDDPDQANIQ